MVTVSTKEKYELRGIINYYSIFDNQWKIGGAFTFELAEDVSSSLSALTDR